MVSTIFDVVVLHDSRRSYPVELCREFPGCRVLIDGDRRGVGFAHLRAVEFARRNWLRNGRLTLIVEDDAVPGAGCRGLVDDWLRRVFVQGGEGVDKRVGAVSFFLGKAVKTVHQAGVDKRFTDALLRSETFMFYPDLLHGVAYVLNPRVLGFVLDVLRERVEELGSGFTDVDTCVGGVVVERGWRVLYPLMSLFEHGAPVDSLVAHRGRRPDLALRVARLFNEKKGRL